jgi:DNA-binding transcriptional ArsR family regulator
MVVGLIDYRRGDGGRGHRTDRIFHALADSTRRDIVLTALAGEHSVSALARRYPMSFAAVQKHVAVLERAGLVDKRAHGREQLVSGNVAAIREAFTALEQLEAVWRGRAERFGDVLGQLPPHLPPDLASTPFPSTPAEGAPT